MNKSNNKNRGIDADCGIDNRGDDWGTDRCDADVYDLGKSQGRLEGQAMMIAIGVILTLFVLAWDGIVIFFLDGDIENIFEEEDEDGDDSD